MAKAISTPMTMKERSPTNSICPTRCGSGATTCPVTAGRRRTSRGEWKKSESRIHKGADGKQNEIPHSALDKGRMEEVRSQNPESRREKAEGGIKIPIPHSALRTR